MIEGVGIALVDLARFARARERFGERFLTRAFSAEEREYAFCRLHPDPHLAGRLAAKFALCKALGRMVPLHRLSVVRSGGPPRLELDGEPLAALLTISHTDEWALAHVLIEARG